jgi:pimeloyl-ACP methyl ester carboxylesterase
MREVLVRVVNEQYGDELARIKCPVLFIWGQADTSAPISAARRAALLVRNCEFWELEGAHDIHLTHGAVVRSHLEALLGRVGSM